MAAKDHIPDWFHVEMDKQAAAEEKLIAVLHQNVTSELSGQVQAARERNCFYCMHFDRVNDTCLIAKPPSRPPMFILVHGCAQYHHEDNIPY